MEIYEKPEIGKALAENYPGILALFDFEGKLQFANASYHTYFSGSEWGNVVEKVLEKEIFEKEWTTPGSSSFYIRYLLPQGRTFPISVRILPITGNWRLFMADLVADVGQKELVLELDRIKEELSKQKAYAENLKKKIEEWEHTDSLTGVYHRKYFTKILHTEWSRAVRYGHILSMMAFDLDGLKAINTQYGPDYGDSVLQETTQQVSKIIRKSDVLGRYEGGTFLVILPETDVKKVFPMAERLRENIQYQRFYALEGAFSVTASFGITQAFSVGNDTPELCMKRALRALTRAKQLGKNRIEIWLT